MSSFKIRLIAAALVLAVLLFNTLFAVGEGEAAVIGQFGQIMEVVTSPGLHAKFPWQSRTVIDSRLQTYNPLATELLTRDKKNLIVDPFLVWRVSDPRRFVQSVGDRDGAETRLQDIARSELSIGIGGTELSSIVSTSSSTDALEALMSQVTQQCDRAASEQYGVQVVHVGLRRLNLPEENKESVFARMRAERERIARQYRAQGAQEAARIKAEADREKTQILARAYEQAERLKGEGDARATRIYASAFNRDPRFYKMTRTLDAYRKFLNRRTTVVLSTDSELMRLLSSGSPQGKRR